MNEFEWRRIAAEKPPQWYGDLNDDCSAIWAGFLLRAEWENGEGEEASWWWAVYDDKTRREIESSNNHEGTPYSTGDSARSAAEQAARRYLGVA